MTITDARTTTTDAAPGWRSGPASVVAQLRGPREGHPPCTATTVAEAARAPGLVITPAMVQDIAGGWSFTGGWEVRHQQSGYVVVPGCAVGLGHARDLAVLLGELDVDWTRSTDALPLRDPTVRDDVGEIREQLCDAVADGRPVRVLPTSWQPIPPPYLWVCDGDFFGRPYRGFIDAADAATRWPGDPAGMRIARDTVSWWHLVCASHDCQCPLTGYDVATEPDRDLLAEWAADEGWHPLDSRRWLCDHCNPLFTPTVPRNADAEGAPR